MHACRSGRHSSRVPNKNCHVSGGWGDFFATGNDVLPNWTPEAEREEGKACVRIKAQDVVDMLHKLDVGTMELDAVAATKVSYTFKPLRHSIPDLMQPCSCRVLARLCSCRLHRLDVGNELNGMAVTGLSCTLGHGALHHAQQDPL